MREFLTRADMGRYFFDIKDGLRSLDRRGVECVNDAEAIEWARLMAAQAPREGEVQYVIVIDPTGQEIARVKIDASPAIPMTGADG